MTPLRCGARSSEAGGNMVVTSTWRGVYFFFLSFFYHCHHHDTPLTPSLLVYRHLRWARLAQHLNSLKSRHRGLTSTQWPSSYIQWSSSTRERILLSPTPSMTTHFLMSFVSIDRPSEKTVKRKTTFLSPFDPGFYRWYQLVTGVARLDSGAP
jgi:hypothetical protein